MSDEKSEKAAKSLERSVRRLVDAMFDSPIVAAEWEASGKIVTDFPPSRYNLGPMLKILQPDVYFRTRDCTQEQLRTSEALAFEDHRPALAGLIARSIVTRDSALTTPMDILANCSAI